jgi:hypothetical protein
MNNISLNGLPKQLSNFFHRYHVLTFSLIVLGGMAVAILLLNNILQVSAQPTKDVGVDTVFDATTIERVNQLKTSSDASEDISFPTGRINPFVE